MNSLRLHESFIKVLLIFFSERLSYSLEEKMNNNYFFTYVTNRTLVNDSIRYDNNIYNEKIIIGAGLKILL